MESSPYQSGILEPGKFTKIRSAGIESYRELMDMDIINNWLPGQWIPSQSTQTDSITFNSGIWQDDRERCIRWVQDYDWVSNKPNSGPIRYAQLVDRTCTVLWDTVLAHSNTEPGHTVELPRIQYHISGWFYAQTSQTSLRTISVQDPGGNTITRIRQRDGRILQEDSDYPTDTLIAQDEWHYWSLDISRVRPIHQNYQLQVANSQYETEPNGNDNYLGFSFQYIG